MIVCGYDHTILRSDLGAHTGELAVDLSEASPSIPELIVKPLFVGQMGQAMLKKPQGPIGDFIVVLILQMLIEGNHKLLAIGRRIGQSLAGCFSIITPSQRRRNPYGLPPA